MTESQPDYMIETGNGNCPQKIDYWCYIERRSHLVQFAARLGLTKENELLMIAIEQAYTFIYSNYELEDQVLLYFYLTEMYSDHNLKAAEILIKHLQNGTCPGNSSESQPSSGSNVPPMQIPIQQVTPLLNFVEQTLISVFKWHCGYGWSGSKRDVQGERRAQVKIPTQNRTHHMRDL
ncbi:unnamed protein product [Rhizoctonia solani]|uniref:Uncharacterized protein n=1 Tax=Rhizoctonia solani TaxID=456999 RepID=A0A8H3BUI8_9AGAM|nr:unnamed protein product [Rhizoctonia solani]